MDRIKSVLFFLVFLVYVSIVSATCDEGQIDINTASAEELDNLYGIGPVKAQAIIDSRPFETVDDLINVNGIGDITLNKIKEQGLACVDQNNEESSSSSENSTGNEDESESATSNENEIGGGSGTEDSTDQSESSERTNTGVKITNLNATSNKTTVNKSAIVGQVINLNPEESKDIKTNSITEKTYNGYGVYSIIIFCILLALLFFMRKKAKKDEFD